MGSTAGQDRSRENFSGSSNVVQGVTEGNRQGLGAIGDQDSNEFVGNIRRVRKTSRVRFFLHSRSTLSRYEPTIHASLDRIRVLRDDGSNARQWLSSDPKVKCSSADLALFTPLLRQKLTSSWAAGSKHRSKRCGIDGTLHRVAVTTMPTYDTPGNPKVIGITVRVGRSVENIIQRMLPDLLHDVKPTERTRGIPHISSSTLLVGRPGVRHLPLRRRRTICSFS